MVQLHIGGAQLELARIMAGKTPHLRRDRYLASSAGSLRIEKR